MGVGTVESDAVGVNVTESVRATGRFVLTVFGEDGNVVDRVESKNLMCNQGVYQLGTAVNWVAIEDQNTNMGSPLSPAFLYPIYGAVGSSSTAATSTDTQLGAELGRTVVSNAGASGGLVVWSFFYGTTVSSWSITEAGVFVSGPAATATATANSGLLLDHTVFGAVTKTSTQTATAVFSFQF